MTLDATIRVMPDTKVRAYDYQSAERPYRIVGIEFDRLNIYFGLGDDDQEKTDALDVLIGALTTLRNSAWTRHVDAELGKRDDQIDAGFGTGYIGEFR